MDRQLIKSIATDFARDTNKDEILDMNVWFDNWWENNKLNYVHAKDFVKKTILEHSNDIIFDRKEEKEREYGPFTESMNRASLLASLISKRSFDTEDMYIAMIALKMSRMHYNTKYDTILDAIGYLAAFNDFNEKKDEQ